MDGSNHLYACELGRLASELMATTPALLRRLECLYDEILIDEVRISVAMTGISCESYCGQESTSAWLGMSARQCFRPILAARKTSNTGTRMREWFRKQEAEGYLSISFARKTYRCRTEIAGFSDSIFHSAWGFPETESENNHVTGHDGVFLVHSQHVSQYVDRFRPQCLRYSATSAKAFSLEFMNFKASKGATFERVLIAPTAKIEAFIKECSSRSDLSGGVLCRRDSGRAERCHHPRQSRRFGIARVDSVSR